MTYREIILQDIEAYRVKAGLSDRAFSIAACRNAKFLSRLRNGISTLRSIDAAKQYMQEHPIERPAPASERPAQEVVNV